MAVDIEKQNKYMHAALLEANKAWQEDEVPIGAVVVYQDKIIARGHNRREKTQDPTAHAEIIALRKAAKKLGSWRLEECDLYVTIEPCPMCAGAMLWSRIRTVYFGAREPKGGALVSSLQLYEAPQINHRPEVIEGVLAEECGNLIRDYFRAKRNKI